MGFICGPNRCCHILQFQTILFVISNQCQQRHAERGLNRGCRSKLSAIPRVMVGRNVEAKVCRLQFRAGTLVVTDTFVQ